MKEREEALKEAEIKISQILKEVYTAGYEQGTYDYSKRIANEPGSKIESIKFKES